MRNFLKGLIALSCLLIMMNATFVSHQVSKPKFRQLVEADSTIRLDTTTGLIVAEGLETVRAHCTGCHSAKIVTQFHADKNGWLEKIRWMQQKQKLWDLGEAEPIILAYLAKNYPPNEKVDRRAKLKNVEWYRHDPRGN